MTALELADQIEGCDKATLDAEEIAVVVAALRCTRPEARGTAPEGPPPVGNLKRVTIPARTVVQIGGYPFYVVNDTQVESHPGNIAMLTDSESERALKPQREGQDG